MNEPPTAIHVSLHPVPENQISANIGRITVRDPDNNQTHNCRAVANGTDSTLFFIDNLTMQLKTKIPLNFEVQRKHQVSIRCMDVPSGNQIRFTIFRDVVIDVIGKKLPLFYIYNFIMSGCKQKRVCPCNSKTERRMANLSTYSESAWFN